MEIPKVVFTEKQSFRQWWLWLIVLLATLPTLGILVYQLLTGQLVGDNPAPNWLLALLSLLIPVPLILGFLFARLTTVIDEAGIQYGWNFPSARLNFISWGDIEECSLIHYHFTGYGYRFSYRYGTIYNVSGNMGLQIVKTNGSKLLIGTQKPAEMQKAIDSVRGGDKN